MCNKPVAKVPLGRAYHFLALESAMKRSGNLVSAERKARHAPRVAPPAAIPRRHREIVCSAGRSRGRASGRWRRGCCSARWGKWLARLHPALAREIPT